MDDFFKEYISGLKNTGIPGVTMNAPVTLNTLPGMVGLEIEIEGHSLPRDGHLEAIKGAKTGCMWTAITDGSLRGEAREYVLSVPAAEEEISKMVQELYSVFKSMSRLELSNRCSTHCHINMKGKTVNYVTSAIALWVMFEDVVIPWCGEERTTNHFCLSTKDAPGSLLPTWDSYLRTGAGNFDERGYLKYCALNIYPIFSKGSIEFRCGPKPESAKKVIDFATFCLNLVKYSEKYGNPMNIAGDISMTGAFEMFMQIAPAEMASECLARAGSVQAFDDICLTAFRRAQGICMGFPWDRWQELINKVYVPDPFKTRRVSKPPRRRIIEDAPDWGQAAAIEPEPFLDPERATEVQRAREQIAIDLETIARRTRPAAWLGGNGN